MFNISRLATNKNLKRFSTGSNVRRFNQYRRYHGRTHGREEINEKSNQRKSSYLTYLLALGVLVPFANYFNSNSDAEEHKPEELKKETDSDDEELLYYDYVIIGSGVGACAAYESLRKIHPEAKILIISEEDNLYAHDRIVQLFYEDSTIAYFSKEHFENENTELRTQSEVMYIAADQHTLGIAMYDDIPFQKVKYGSCILATGMSTKIPSIEIPENAKNIQTLNNINEFNQLNDNISNVHHITVIGGGISGTEITAGLGYLAKRKGVDTQIVQISKGDTVMHKYVPKYLGDQIISDLEKYYGTQVRTEAEVAKVENINENSLLVTLSNGDSFETDYIVLATGPKPNTDVTTPKLERDENGHFIANGQLLLAKDLYATVDIASFYGKNQRATQQNSFNLEVSAQLAVTNMTGGSQFYNYDTVASAELGPIGNVNIIGKSDTSLENVGVWQRGNFNYQTDEELDRTFEEQNIYKQGVVYALKDKKIKNVILWNMPPKSVVGALYAILFEREYESHEDLARVVPFEENK